MRFPVLALALAACGSSAKPVSSPRPLANTSFVVVHGAWMGAWSWDPVATRLRDQGATVTVVELPGHGADTTPVPQTGLDAYVATVGKALDASASKVVLVDHSMAGIVISQVAEQHPDKLAALVYLAAYVPRDQETLQALAATDGASHVGPALQIDAERGVAGLPADKLQDIFCADCSPESAALIRERYRPEPLPAFGAPVRVTADGWGRVPRFYIYTSQDHAVSPDLQRRMTAGITWAGTATLDTSHAPFLSKPDLVVDTLAKLSPR